MEAPAASQDRQARGRRFAAHAREREALREAVQALDADSLAKLKTDDRLLYFVYAEYIGRIIDIGEPSTGLDKAVDINLERRGEEAAILLARIFREEPCDGVRRYILRWLEWKFNFPAAPVLDEVRRLYWSEGKVWDVSMQSTLADTLAARGLAPDMAILEDLQKQRGKDWFLGQIQRLQKRIRFGEERGDATGELPLIPRNTSPTVEPTPLPPYGQATSAQKPAVKPANLPAASTATVPPPPAKDSSSPVIPIAAGAAILIAILLLWRLRLKEP